LGDIGRQRNATGHGVDAREITGLKNKADADDWMNGDRRVAWLRSQG
jgi:hypothetical protein